MSSKAKNRTPGHVEEDVWEDDSEDQEQEREEGASRKRAADASGRQLEARKRVRSLIDDAAELSGSDDSGDDDSEDSEEQDAADYERDGFVVDEDGSEARRNELEDSDSSSAASGRPRRRIQRMRDRAELDEEDLALIEENRLAAEEPAEEDPVAPPAEPPRHKTITASSEAELRKELFLDDSDDDPGPPPTAPPRARKDKAQAARRARPAADFDEDGLDDFIDYQEDDDAYLDADQRREAMDRRRLMHLNELQQDSAYMAHRKHAPGVTQAQLHEATDIFGDEYLDLVQSSHQRDWDDPEHGDDEDDDDDEFMDTRFTRNTSRTRLPDDQDGFESTDEQEYPQDDDDDDDLDDIDDDDDPDSSMSRIQRQQQSQVKRLHREKKMQEKQERRRQAAILKNERRKARLKKAFEPVQLVHNFCTDKDDLIRNKDEPERFFEWITPFHGPSHHTLAKANALTDAISEEELEEAIWIMGRIPDIATEFFHAATVKVEAQDSMDLDAMPKKQKDILDSISYALRYMHREKLEPEFIRRYRADIVTSAAVRLHLYTIMDDDAEWDRLLLARNKVTVALQNMNSFLDSELTPRSDEQNLIQVRDNIQKAQERYDMSIQQERHIREQIRQLDGGAEHALDQYAQEDLFDNEDAPDEEPHPTEEGDDKVRHYLHLCCYTARGIDPMVLSLSLTHTHTLSITLLMN
jgi:hypothetical protein